MSARTNPHVRVTSRLLGCLFAAFLVLTLTTCSSDDPAEPAPPADGIIGPAGGTVTDTGGASVVIPPGALTDDIAITVETYTDPESGPYPTGPVPVFWGGAQYGPPGTEFDKPVTIVMPTRQDLEPGDEYQLFLFDTNIHAWKITGESATVNPDGQTLKAEVNHFSLINGGGFAGGSAARSGITSQLCQFGSALAICLDYVDYFREYVADVGDKGVYDNECKEVVGLSMDVTCTVNEDYAFVPVRDGELDGEQVSIFDPDGCAIGDDFAILEVWATIYYRCSQPEVEAAADPAEIEEGGSSTVIATLKCGEVVFPGQSLEFENFGIGEIDRNSAGTNTAGQAQVMYSNDEGEGEATIRAYYDACAGKPNAGMVMGETTVTTVGGWSGTLNANFDHPIGSTPLDLFSDGVTIDFEFSIDEEGTVTGSGTGSHAVDITPGGDCWTSSVDAPGFAVTVYGSSTEQEIFLAIVPNPMMPVSFVITCPHGDTTEDYPFPMAEGLLEGEILTQDISIQVVREEGATDAGSGSRSGGSDIPMHYSWSVTVHKGDG